MTAPVKRLFILSLDRKVNKFLCNIIHNVIGREVAVSGASLAEADACFAGADLVLTSGAALLSDARRRFPQCPVMAPRRIIAGYNLEKVLMLPKATPVLVVNHPREATEETIASLKSLGLDHLRYFPYWQGSAVPEAARQAKTAVSPGMGHLTPDHIETLIDIGPRLISLASFARLLLALDLDLGYLEHYADQYHHFLLASSRKLADALGYAELMGKRNEVILDEFEEGVVSVNARGRIDRANRSAFDLLHLAGGDILNRRMDRIFQELEKVADLIEPGSQNAKSAGIYTCRDKQLIVTKIPVESGRQRSHLYTLREIARMQRLEKDVRIKLARKGYLGKYSFDDIQGSSPALQAAIARARRFAQTEKNILITGESGTGKELFAHAIHHASLRAGGPFLAVNFAGLPETLIESELFGFEEGAFTGARRGGKAGLFEQAHGGTLFLDEIGDASPAVQSRLLRVVQEREVLRVGGSRIIPVEVRIVAATNSDLQQAVAAGRFREDLYFRLNTLPLEIPPLRERGGDIIAFFNGYIEKHYHIRKELEPAAAKRLTAYNWPGNLRELINSAEYALIASEGKPKIDLVHLPPALLRGTATQAGPAAAVESPDGSPVELALEYGELRGRVCGGPLTADVLRVILAILGEAGPGGIGRNSLRRRLQERRLALSEGFMKSALKRLRREGLVVVGSTRQGTGLTPRGESFLGFLTMHPDRGL